MPLHYENITIKRFIEGSYIKGHYQQGISISFTGLGNIQPLNGKELLQLAEGDREKESIKIYSFDLAFQNDDILIDQYSNEYELQKIKNNSDKLLPHYKAIGLKKN